MRQYATVYNQLTEKCFRHCINQLNIGSLSHDEVTNSFDVLCLVFCLITSSCKLQAACTEACAEQLLKASYRITTKAVQLGPMGQTPTGSGMS